MPELQINEFATRDALDARLADQVAAALQTAIAERGRASLVVSGGSTPAGFFRELAGRPLDWSRLTVTLADDRWVPPDHSDSNERLVRQTLLIGDAKAARFLSLVTDAADPGAAVEAVSRRVAELGTVDFTVLGMGGDGHFASLFPGSDALDAGLDSGSGQALVAVNPPKAAHARMSMTLPRLLNSRRLVVHLVGAEKRRVLEQAARDRDPRILPIAAVIASESPLAEVYWAP